MRAHWKPRTPGQMNDTERWWAGTLEAAKLAGLIHDWRYEPITLRLAKLTSYKPDFFVLETDGSITFQECKGSWKAPGQSDSRAKIKIAAELFPWFKFEAVELKKLAAKRGGGYTITKRETFG